MGVGWVRGRVCAALNGMELDENKDGVGYTTGVNK